MQDVRHLGALEAFNAIAQGFQATSFFFLMVPASLGYPTCSDGAVQPWTVMVSVVACSEM